MSRYELWLLLHVLAAALWAGGGTLLAVTGLSAQLRGAPVAMPQLGPINAWVGPRIFLPSSVVAAVSGVLLVEDGPWSWGDVWVTLGVVGFVLSFLPGLVFLGPESGRLAAAAQELGPGHPDVARRLRRFLLVSRLVILLLLFVLADMVLKPTGDDGWLLGLGAIVLVAAAVALSRVGRGARPAPPGGSGPAPA